MACSVRLVAGLTCTQQTKKANKLLSREVVLLVKSKAMMIQRLGLLFVLREALDTSHFALPRTWTLRDRGTGFTFISLFVLMQAIVRLFFLFFVCLCHTSSSESSVQLAIFEILGLYISAILGKKML